jgi:hypothetical protein
LASAAVEQLAAAGAIVPAGLACATADITAIAIDLA